MLIPLLIIIIIGGGVFLLLSFRKKKSGSTQKKGGLLQYYARGKDSGFTFRELELLRKLALKSDLLDPSDLLWSQQYLDFCIRTYVKTARLSGNEQNPETQEFLSKLYDYRKKLEIDKSKGKIGLANAREIEEGARVLINLKSIGNFNSRVIKNTNHYLTIARPTSTKVPQSFAWTGQHIAIFYQRENDAGYVFDTTVMDEVFSKGYAALQINQPEKLDRTQRRNSIRIKTHKSAFLYIKDDDEPDFSLETVSGYRCILDDLSDSGCAISIGGKGVPGLKVKIQFVLNATPMAMCGIVRAVSYDEDENRSVLHIQSDELPKETRNQILAEVFGMLEDDEAVLPFRVIDEEIQQETFQA